MVSKVRRAHFGGASDRSVIANCPRPSPGRTLDHRRYSRGLAYDAPTSRRFASPGHPAVKEKKGDPVTAPGAAAVRD